jgi:hypothetical protein
MGFGSNERNKTATTRKIVYDLTFNQMNRGFFSVEAEFKASTQSISQILIHTRRSWYNESICALFMGESS